MRSPLPPGRPVDRHLHDSNGASGRQAEGEPQARLLFVSWIKVRNEARPHGHQTDTLPVEGYGASTDVPATAGACRKRRRPEPAGAAAEAADEACRCPALEVAGRSDPQGPPRGLVFFHSRAVQRHDGRVRDRFAAGVLHDRHSRPTGHQDHPRQQRRQASAAGISIGGSS